jgi:hypothetical protein
MSGSNRGLCNYNTPSRQTDSRSSSPARTQTYGYTQWLCSRNSATASNAKAREPSIKFYDISSRSSLILSSQFMPRSLQALASIPALCCSADICRSSPHSLNVNCAMKCWYRPRSFLSQRFPRKHVMISHNLHRTRVYNVKNMAQSRKVTM